MASHSKPMSSTRTNVKVTEISREADLPSHANQTLLSACQMKDEEGIISVLQTADPLQVNEIPSGTWARVIPFICSWLQQIGTLKHIMAFSIAYHISEHCPETFSRQDVWHHMVSFTAECRDQINQGLDLSSCGGLQPKELRMLLDRLSRKFDDDDKNSGLNISFL